MSSEITNEPCTCGGTTDKEMLWFSPACGMVTERKQGSLFLT